jgi:hypothetical protein
VRTSERRVPIIATLAPVALLLLAWLVARLETPAMAISPSPAAPGDTVRIRFAEPQTVESAVTLQRGDQVFTLPGTLPGDEEVILSTELPVEPPDSVVSTVGSAPVAVLEVTMPYEVGRGSYRVCSLPLGPEEEICTTLTVGFGEG